MNPQLRGRTITATGIGTVGLEPRVDKQVDTASLAIDRASRCCAVSLQRSAGPLPEGALAAPSGPATPDIRAIAPAANLIRCLP